MKPFDDVLSIKISHPFHPSADMERPGEDISKRKQFVDAKPEPKSPLEGLSRVLDNASRLSPALDPSSRLSPSLMEDACQVQSSDDENDLPKTAIRTRDESHRMNQGNDQVNQVKPPLQSLTPTPSASDVEDSSVIRSSWLIESSVEMEPIIATNDDPNTTQQPRIPLHSHSTSLERNPLSTPNASIGVEPLSASILRERKVRSGHFREDANETENDHVVGSTGADLPPSRSPETRTQHDTIEASRNDYVLLNQFGSNEKSEGCSSQEAKCKSDHSKPNEATRVLSSSNYVKRTEEGEINMDDSVSLSTDPPAANSMWPAPSCDRDDDDELSPWTMDQHRAFVSAVFEIGLKHCSPSVIMDSMKNLPSDITREKTKSHLQKFRKTSERSLEEFIGEYDDFMKVIEGQKDVMTDGDDQDHTDSQKKVVQQTKESLDSQPTKEDHSALLTAALKGMDPDKLLGGTAAAFAAYSVAYNCPMEDRSNAIPYEAAPEDFPALTEMELKSSVGQSLLKVKGALEFITEFILKSRHGIPMKLDKTMPPFLKKEDVATVLPHHLSTNSGGIEAVPDQRNGNQIQVPLVEQGMYPLVPGYSGSYPGYLNSHPGYNTGIVHNAMAHQPGYGSVPPSCTLYPYGGHQAQTMGPHFMATSFPNQQIFVPDQLPHNMANSYPPHLHPPSGVGAPYAPPFHGHSHFAPPLPYQSHSGYDYPNVSTSSHDYVSHHQFQQDGPTPSYYGGQKIYSDRTLGHSHIVPSYTTESCTHKTAASPTESNNRREQDLWDTNDRSPPLRKIFDMVPSKKASSHQRGNHDIVDGSVQCSPRAKYWLNSSSKDPSQRSHLNMFESSPIYRQESSKKKRSWSPSPTDEDRLHKRSREAIFRVDTARKSDGRGDLERPSSTLSFNMEDLDLRPANETPRSNSTASPVTTVLRDMMWAPLVINTNDDNHANPYHDKGEGRRSKRNIFSPTGDTNISTPESRSQRQRRRKWHEIHPQESTLMDRVALDFGMKVPPSTSEEDAL